MTDPTPRLFLRVYLTETDRVGPGKAALLEGIARSGSIAAAGRALGMSYKRAWSLVEEMNALFADPLVASARGGAGGGGAHLTEAGARVLALFREVEAAARVASDAPRTELGAMLRDMSGGK